MAVRSSKYHRSSEGFDRPAPECVFEIDVVSGEEGRGLRIEQARAIREVLACLRESRGGRGEHGRRAER